MKQDIKQAFIILMIMSMAFVLVQCTATAQTLTINPKIQLNGKYTLEKIKVTIKDMDTVDAHALVVLNVIKKFDYKLEDNKDYLIIFEVDGFQSKSIMVSTNYTSNQPYIYTFKIDLSNEDVMPYVQYAGGIYYDKGKKRGNGQKGDFTYYKTNIVQFAEN